MFYLLILVWVVGCTLICTTRKMSRYDLITTCPCLAGAGIILGIILFIYGRPVLGILALIGGIGLSLYLGGTALFREQDEQNISA
jgi:hypothetical protein